MMEIRTKYCLTLLTIAALCEVSLTADKPSTKTDPEMTLNRVLDAIDRALDFFMVEHERVNLDAIIGTRMVEGQLTVLLHHVNQPDGPHVSEEVEQKLTAIHEKAERVSDLATPFVQRTQPNYYHKIGPILKKGFWKLDYPSTDVDRSLMRQPLVDGEAMHEDDSDDCLTELFGTSDKTTKTCQVSRRCWQMMTSAGYRGYSLSHEVFYLEIGQMFGCLAGDVVPVVNRLTAGFCANLYVEAANIAQSGLPRNDQDFFMEIPALCGMLGYRQFFRDDWLEAMLGWQWPRGCWGTTEQPIPKAVNDRFKREEKRFPDGCQCHRTAVAIGALSQYVRYIIEYINLQTVHMR